MRDYNDWNNAEWLAEWLKEKEESITKTEIQKWEDKGWSVCTWRTKGRSKYHPLGGWMHMLRTKGDCFRHVMLDARHGKVIWRTSMVNRSTNFKCSGIMKKLKELRQSIIP